jgi:hypothetical protein
MTLPVVFTANGPSGYNLTKSLRFRSSANAYLNRTPASATNRKTWTYSAWVKRGVLGTYQRLMSVTVGSDEHIIFRESPVDTLHYVSGSASISLITSQVFRDPSAWYHIVVAVDTTQATASNRAKMYVNGVQITAFSTATYPAQNADTSMNNTLPHGIGGPDFSQYFDGYMGEMNFIDGQALTPSSFGSTNATTGVWQPAKYTGTYGTNGFYLPFTNTTSTTTLGYDFSGNSNNWTTNNLSLTAGTTYDSMTDVPTLTSATTANYCVMNPLDTTGGSITNGNLTVTTTGSNINCRASFVIPTTGKWYFETTDVVTGGNNIVGIANSTLAISASQTGATGSIYTGMFSNAVYGFAFNFDALTYTIYKNNSVDASGSITSGIAYSIFIATSASGGASTAFNFGQQGFAYTPPTGFNALNTYNLPTSTIVKGNTVMDATTYTGNGGTQTITNAGGFKPDFVWMKKRSSAESHILQNSIAGTTKFLISNSTAAEDTSSAIIQSFDSTGFTVGASSVVNGSATTYVGWQWQAGQGTTSSNTSGSITSTVSVNASAGFSIVQFTATGSNATVGHGLGVAPAVVIVKDAASVGNWAMYNKNLTSAAYYLYLNTTAAQDNTAQIWNSTAPTSSVFSIGTWHTADRQIAYCWSEIAGFSKFGSYTGNGSTDGVFIYTGFRPKFIMLKNSTTAASWSMLDTSRNTYNISNARLFAESSQVEDTSQDTMDILSNGFKLRATGLGVNGSGSTIIYMAFAENPFKNALAR